MVLMILVRYALEPVIHPYDMAFIIKDRVRDFEFPEQYLLNLAEMCRETDQLVDHRGPVIPNQEKDHNEIKQNISGQDETCRQIDQINEYVYCSKEDTEVYRHLHISFQSAFQAETILFVAHSEIIILKKQAGFNLPASLSVPAYSAIYGISAIWRARLMALVNSL